MRRLSAVTILTVMAGLATVPRAREADLPIRGLRLPLKFFDDGTVQLQLLAAAASMPAGKGPVEAADAEVKEFDSEGQVVMSFQAERCRYDQDEGRVRSKTPVRMERPGLVVTGTGMDWDTVAERIILLSDVRLEFTRGGGLGTLLPPASAGSASR